MLRSAHLQNSDIVQNAKVLLVKLMASQNDRICGLEANREQVPASKQTAAPQA